MIDTKMPSVPKYTSDAFDNVEYQLQITHTVDTDLRIMSFVDVLWGFEVTGGVDQFEPLTIIAVLKTGLARRAGMRVGDIITQINTTPASGLTLLEAQRRLIRQSGRYVRIYVTGDTDADIDDEYTVDFWFKPRKPWRRDFEPIQWEFPWNDRRKPVYKESNCYMVPSRFEDRLRSRRQTASGNLFQKEGSYAKNAGKQGPPRGYSLPPPRAGGATNKETENLLSAASALLQNRK